MTPVPAGRLPLVVVPGLGLATPVYARLAAALPQADVHVVHLPGYGHGVRRGDPVTPPDLARLLLAEATRLGLERFALLGHSSSCQVVAEAAAAAPDRVPALVLVGPTTDPRARTWPRLVVRWLATAVHERPSQAPLLVRVYARTGLGSMRRAMDASRRHDVACAVARTACPLLVVRGRYDRIAPSDWTRSLAAQPGGREVSLPVGAHMVPITHARRLAALVGPWLAAAPGGGAPGGGRPRTAPSSPG